jgi:hypothetical protein
MTTTDHSEKVRQLRSLIRRNVCSTLRVVMSRGTAWGNVKIKGSGEFGVFNENEKSALSKHNFNYGANCGIIMYESVDATIARLQKIETANSITSITGAGREAILAQRFESRFINIAATTIDGRAISTQVWAESQDEADNAAERILVKWCTPDQERWHGKLVLATIFDMKTKQTRCFKVRGSSIYDITDEVVRS